MKGTLKLGRIAGIKIEVHWTFSLLLIWVIFLDIQRGGNLSSSILNVVFILLLFLCVVLHELGHALTARRFKINTKGITLLPIGGVASLEKMPEKPAQELVVALAGPAVNILIAALLLLFVPLQTYLELDVEGLEQLMASPSIGTLLFYLLVANIMLVAFNMIPAFPMDGGRVFRALLSFAMDRTKATEIAASLGQLLAVIFFVLGLFYNPFLVLIALFIFIGAYGENKMVRQTSLVAGHVIGEATLTNITFLKPESPLSEVIDILIAGTEKDFIVMDGDQPTGLLYHKDILKNAKNGRLTVGALMNTQFVALRASGPLQEFFNLMGKQKNLFFPVIDESDRVIGAIDMSNVSEFLVLKTHDRQDQGPA
jgi:Zn-dependent protease